MNLKFSAILLAASLLPLSTVSHADVEANYLESVSDESYQFTYVTDKRKAIVYTNRAIKQAGGFSRLKEDAENGDGDALYVMHNVYKYGVAHKVSPSLSYSYLLKSVQTHNPRALFDYGMYLMGYNKMDLISNEIVNKTQEGKADAYNRGINLISISAFLGDAESQYVLGLHYVQGKSVPSDRDLGLFWLSKADSNGFKRAASARERILSTSDYLEDFNRTQKDAKYGSDDALVKLAKFYINNHIVGSDLNKAKRLLKNAAALGNEEAASILREKFKYSIFGIPTIINDL